MLVFALILLVLWECVQKEMITNGESAICRVIAIDQNGKPIPPCGACREFMTQLMPDNYHGIEIILDYENKKVVTLGDITPDWWL